MAASTTLLSDFTDPRFRGAFQDYFAELKITVRDWNGLFREMDAGGTNRAWLLPDEAGEVCGFLLFQVTGFSHWFFQEPFGFIREFWVHPAHRRQGYGRELLRLTEDYFAAHDAYRSILTADTAVEFYLANGYRRAPGIRAKNKMEVLSKVLY